MNQPRSQAFASLPPLVVGSWSLEERRPRKAEKRDPENEVNYGLVDRKLSQSRDYRDVIVFENLRFQNVFRSNENEKSFSKSVLEKIRFIDGLVCRNKAAFSNFSDNIGC